MQKVTGGVDSEIRGAIRDVAKNFVTTREKTYRATILTLILLQLTHKS